MAIVIIVRVVVESLTLVVGHPGSHLHRHHHHHHLGGGDHIVNAGGSSRQWLPLPLSSGSWW